MKQDNGQTTEAEFVKIAILEDPIEAQVIGDILETEAIPHLLRSYHDTAYDGLFQSQYGWGEVRALAPYRKQILEILDEVRSENRGEDG